MSQTDPIREKCFDVLAEIYGCKRSLKDCTDNNCERFYECNRVCEALMKKEKEIERLKESLNYTDGIVSRDATDRDRVIADLQEKLKQAEAPICDTSTPNLEMLSRGACSGGIAEWPMLKTEARFVLLKIKSLEEKLKAKDDYASGLCCDIKNLEDKLKVVEQYVKNKQSVIYDKSEGLIAAQQRNIELGKEVDALTSQIKTLTHEKEAWERLCSCKVHPEKVKDLTQKLEEAENEKNRYGECWKDDSNRLGKVIHELREKLDRAREALRAAIQVIKIKTIPFSKQTDCSILEKTLTDIGG